MKKWIVIALVTCTKPAEPEARTSVKGGVIFFRESKDWVVIAVGPNYDPVFVKAGRRVYVVDEEQGLKRRCEAP